MGGVVAGAFLSGVALPGLPRIRPCMDEEEKVTEGRGIPNSQQFLETFAEIERLLRIEAHLPVDSSLPNVIKHVAHLNAIVDEYQVELDQYSRLRNALSHERLGGKPLAEPRDDVVRSVKSILGMLSDPPLTGRVFRREVTVFSEADKIFDFAFAVWANGYSQAPIYSKGGFRGLLAAETLARWIGSSKDSAAKLAENVTVGEVLKCAETSDNYEFVSESTPVSELVSVFERAVREGRQLDAALVTDDGTSDGALLGIVTVWDLPKAYRCLHGLSVD